MNTLNSLISPILSRHSSFYKVLHTSELNETVIIKNHLKHDFLQNDHDLTLAELEKIKYWKPNIVGEIIFNYWD
ncbi:hypothetical protein [Bacillus sp. D386]|uniref:hypothetical protein n=1 Tax=Bacillus sp. D386 TaxID=2587155 RepID=UPI001121978E|nr:hypothetical protein [Bacillus sp. D386]